MCVKTIQIDYEGNCEGHVILSNVPDTDEFFSWKLLSPIHKPVDLLGHRSFFTATEYNNR